MADHDEQTYDNARADNLKAMLRALAERIRRVRERAEHRVLDAGLERNLAQQGGPRRHVLPRDLQLVRRLRGERF